MEANEYYFQIDFLKGLAIIAVLILHILPPGWGNLPIVVLTLAQCVPIFFLLMGLNTSMSFKRKNLKTIRELYSLNYFKKKFLRLLPSFFIVFILFLVLCLFKGTIIFDWKYLIGMFPHGTNWYTPGNYFISAVFQFTLIFPLIYYLYKKYSLKSVLIASFIINILFEIISRYTLFYEYSFLYSACLLRYLFIIVLGIYLMDNLNLEHVKDFLSNKFLIIGLFISLLFGLTIVFGWVLPLFPPVWTSSKILLCFYPVLLCVLALRYLPKGENNIISYLGRASYHIFLLQIFIFCLYSFIKPFIPFYCVFFIPFLCLGLGYLFYLFEKS